MSKSVSSLRENRLHEGGKEKVGLRAYPGRESGSPVGPPSDGTEESTRLRDAVVPQLLRCALGPALGTRSLLMRPTVCAGQAVTPPTPTTWLPATEKASVSFLASGGRGHVWGQVCHLAGAADSRGGWGLSAHSLRGPISP